MKIAIVNSHVSERVGGSEIQCDLLARGLSERGHDVIYIAPNAQPTDNRDFLYTICAVPSNSERIAQKVLSLTPDVVYWRFNKNSFRSVARACKKNNLPFVFAAAHVNDLLPTAAKRGRLSYTGKVVHFMRRVSAWHNHRGFQDITALTVNNPDLVNISPVADTTYIPNGMIEEKKVFSWPRPFVAWVANIKPSKRPESFIELARPLAEVGIDALMAGRIQSSDYGWIADASATPENFYFLGPRSLAEVNGILAASRLHVHTCEPEGFGNIFIQAWLQSKPSISLEVDPGGFISSVGVGATADADPAVFRKLVLEWATDPARCAQAGSRALEFAQSHFDPETMVCRVEELMRRVRSKP